MSAAPHALVCDRVRAQISLRLDGELSQLETRMLAAHLSHCADCRAYEADVVRITTELRSAPLERMDNPIVIRRPRRVSALRLQAGVAAALAIATVGVVLQTAVPGPERSSNPYTRTLTEFGNSGEAAQELRQIIADARAFKRHGQKSTVAM